MIMSRKWLQQSFTTLIDAERTTRGKRIAVDDWMTLILHYFDYGDGFTLNTQNLTKAISSISGGNRVIHTCYRNFQDDSPNKEANTNAKTKHLKLVFYCVGPPDRTFQPKVPQDAEEWNNIRKKSSKLVEKLCRLRTGIPSFQDRATTAMTTV